GRAASAAPKYGNSLDWVPADAVFYSTSLRLREQYDIVAQSNAFKKLAEMPAVQMGLGFAQMTWYAPGGPGEQVREFFGDPENKELLDLIVDGVSSEIMVYGDRSAADFVELLLRTMNAVQYGSVAAANSDSGEDPENVTGRIVLRTLDAHREHLNSPGIVFGFKVTDAQRAENQLKRLEEFAKPLLDEEPQFQGRLKHTTVAGTDYLTLELDGSMVPWDEVPWSKLEEKPGEFDQLKQKLEGLRLVVSLGVRDNYLLLSIAGSPAQLAELGKGKLLAELPELQPLAKFTDQRITNISYVSKSMLDALSSSGRDFDQIVQVLQQVLPEAGLPEELNQKIIKDAGELAGDLKGSIPEAAAATAFSFITPQGVEGYRYDWTANQYFDATKPLDILNHVGGTPILAVAGRSKYSPQHYELVRKWMQKAFGYFEEIALPQFSAEEKAHYEKVKAAGMPLVQRLDETTGKMLLPSLADGQTALVLDAKATSKKWFEDMPAADQPLAMIDMGLVFGVSDESLLKKAFVEYLSIADGVVDHIKQTHHDALPPDFKLPAPVAQPSKVGTIYAYPFPESCGVDAQLAFNGGSSAHFAAVSFQPLHTEKLLIDTPLEVSPQGPLADRKKPLAAAIYFNWAGLVEAGTPWIDYAVQQMGSRAAEGAGVGALLASKEAETQFAQASTLDPHTKFILEQVHIVLDVLKVWRTSEAATYAENGALVTHSLT
ncbi:MAG TPA: hypothetical protein VGI75_12315, partial [Pirellulales bacterium]